MKATIFSIVLIALSFASIAQASEFRRADQITAITKAVYYQRLAVGESLTGITYNSIGATNGTDIFLVTYQDAVGKCVHERVSISSSQFVADNIAFIDASRSNCYMGM